MHAGRRQPCTGDLCARRSMHIACTLALVACTPHFPDSIEACAQSLTRDVTGPDRTDVPFVCAYALSAVRIPQGRCVILRVNGRIHIDACQLRIHGFASFAVLSWPWPRLPLLRSPHLRTGEQQVSFFVVFEERERPLVSFEQDGTHVGLRSTHVTHVFPLVVDVFPVRSLVSWFLDPSQSLPYRFASGFDGGVRSEGDLGSKPKHPRTKGDPKRESFRPRWEGGRPPPREGVANNDGDTTWLDACCIRTRRSMRVLGVLNGSKSTVEDPSREGRSCRLV